MQGTNTNFISIKSSEYNTYLNVNSDTRILKFDSNSPNTFFHVNLSYPNKMILQSDDGYFVRLCDDYTVRADVLDIEDASLIDLSFINERDTYLISNSNYLYIDSDFILKYSNRSKDIGSLFKFKKLISTTREPFVSIYSDAYYQGIAQPLVPGAYNINQLFIGNDTLSSIKIPEGFSVILYSDANFKGNTLTITKDTPYIGDYFNDKTSSIIVQKLPPNVVQIYSDANYQGSVQQLTPGYYDISQLSIGNDTLSSIKIPEGFVVTLYQDANFKGNYLTLRNDVPYIGDYFNDKVSSIIVTLQR